METLVAMATWALLGAGCVAEVCEPTGPLDALGADLPGAASVIDELARVLGLRISPPPLLEAELPGPDADLAWAGLALHATAGPDLRTGEPPARSASVDEATLHQARSTRSEPRALGHASAGPSPGADAVALAVAQGRAAGGVLVAGALFVLYHMFSKEQVLRHPCRRDILALLDRKPGLCTTQVARELDTSFRTARHHLDMLATHDLVRCSLDGAKLNWFLPDASWLDRAVLTDLDHRMLAIVRGKPGLYLGQVARELDVAKTTAKFHVDRLAAIGLLRTERRGQLRCVYPDDLVVGPK